MPGTETVFRDQPTLEELETTVVAAEPGRVALAATVFYPVGGGQPGDIGTLHWAGGTADVMDTIKDGDTIQHIVEDAAALPALGSPVTARLEWLRRHRHMRMHTALHLLCSLVEGSVTGGQIGAEKSRLDFNVPGSALDKEALTEGLNALIAADHPVSQSFITDEELADNPGLVRTMSVMPPTGTGTVRVIRIGTEADTVDFQPCGGTHVTSTAEIGRVAVTKIENKGKQNRRVVVSLLEA